MMDGGLFSLEDIAAGAIAGAGTGPEPSQGPAFVFGRSSNCRAVALEKARTAPPGRTPCGYRCEPGSAQPVPLSRHRRQHTGAAVMDCGPGFAGAAAMPTASEAEGNGIAGPQDTDQAPRCRKLRTSPQSHRQSLQPLHARRMPQLLSRRSRRCTVSTTCFGFGSGPVLSCGSMAGIAAPPIAEGGAARQAPSAGAGR